MFLYHDKSPITFCDPLPAAVDVVVIGGGVIGISTAWYLLKQGLTVLVCDKGRVAGEQSSRNWGWVRVTGRDQAEVPIAMDSVNCWQEIADELDEDIGFTRQGLLYLAETDQDMSRLGGWLKIAAKHDVTSTLVSKNDLAKHIEVPPGQWAGALMTPGDGRAEPIKAAPAIARGVQARGGIVREQCAARTIDIEAGRVAGVMTEDGRVKTNAVVCAAGAWSNMFLANMGVSFPQLVVRGTVARTVRAPQILNGVAGVKDIFLRRRQDGGYTLATGMTEHMIGTNSFRYLFKFLPTIGQASDIHMRLGRDATQSAFPQRSWGADESSPFEEYRVLNPPPSASALQNIRTNLDARVPGLAGIEIAESWAGMIDTTPDVVPVMDQIDALPGLFLASGFSGHGFGIGPGAGRVMADLVTGSTKRFDLSRFRFSRFSDGSKLRPGPAI
jgi:glycine/D-amino acid oxidase-like deaminating enzyme